MERCGTVVDGSDPDFVRNMKVVGRHVFRGGEGREGLRVQHHLPDRAQVGEPLVKACDHGVGINVHGLDARFVLKAEQGDRYGALKRDPDLLVFFHQNKDGSDYLSQHGR